MTYVNRTFTSHLPLSASLQPYAGLSDHRICEFPFAPKPLALAFTANHLERSDHGEIAAPDSPGLGIDISPAGIQKYLVEVDINVSGKTLYTTPTLP